MNQQQNQWGLVVVTTVVLVLAAFSLGRWSTRPIPYQSPPPLVLGSELPDDLDYRSVEEVYDLLRANYDGPLDPEALIVGLKKGLVFAADDPYTEYLDAQQRAVLQTFLAGGFEGIGIEVIQRNGQLTVVAPIEGSPAFRAGLRPQDIILEIDGQPTNELTIDDAVRLIRGPGGTVVDLKIRRDGVELDKIPITRDLINLPSVRWRVEDQIGIIRINQFNNPTVALMAEAAGELLGQPLQGVILDLRSNPGGDLDQALAVAGFWLELGEVVIEQRVGGQRADPEVVGEVPELPGGQPVFATWPTVVLIDGGSASASEIVAGALRDYGLATLVGEPSFGKGSVQALIEVGDSQAIEILKVTTSHWYTPLGHEIETIGLTPDVVVSNPDPDSEPDPDNPLPDQQLERAKQIILQSQRLE